MASLLRRNGSSSWWVAYADPISGKRIVKSLRTKSEALAQVELRRTDERLFKRRYGHSTSDEDAVAAAATEQLSAHVADHVATLKADQCSDAHYDDVVLVLGLLVESLGGEAARVGDITSKTVDSFLQ